MKNIAIKKIVVIFILLLQQLSYGQTCAERAANKPGTISKHPYETSGTLSKTPFNAAKVTANLTVVENWIKERFKSFTGAKMNYWLTDPNGGSSYSKNFRKITGTSGDYSLTMYFFSYYCYANSEKIYTQEEAGSSILVFFNNPINDQHLAEDIDGRTLDTVKGHKVFKVTAKKKTEGRKDYYEEIRRGNIKDSLPSKFEAILLRNSDKPVFIPFTRKEYLEQILSDIDPKTEESVKNYKKIGEYNKAGNNDKLIAQVINDAKESKALVNQYLKKPADWLNKTINDSYYYTDYSKAKLEEYVKRLDYVNPQFADDSRNELCYLNPDYFNKSIPNDVPQLILISIVKSAYPHMKKAAGLVKEPGVLAPLEALLKKNK
jgi:hypothetical protein